MPKLTRCVELRNSELNYDIRAVDRRVERGNRDPFLARLLDGTGDRSRFDGVDDDRVRLLCDTVLELADLAPGVGLWIMNDEIDAQFVRRFFRAADSGLEVVNLKAERNVADG